MRIVVFSDSHGNYRALRDIVERHPEADLFLHLGDGIREFYRLAEAYPRREMRGVRGNCDLGDGGRTSDMLFARGKRILFTHGHLFGVKRDLEELEHNARKLEAHVVLFGHTHKAVSDYRDGLYLVNPGTAGAAGSKRSYATLDITGAGIAPNLVWL